MTKWDPNRGYFVTASILKYFSTYKELKFQILVYWIFEAISILRFCNLHVPFKYFNLFPI